MTGFYVDMVPSAQEHASKIRSDLHHLLAETIARLDDPQSWLRPPPTHFRMQQSEPCPISGRATPGLNMSYRCPTCGEYATNAYRDKQTGHGIYARHGWRQHPHGDDAVPA